MIRAYDPATHRRGCDCAVCCRAAAAVVRTDALAAAVRGVTA